MTEPTSTERCPLGHRCESCGAVGPDLRVQTVDALGATLCLTLCPGCAGSRRPPSIMLSTAQRLVEQHQQHLAEVTDIPRTRLRST